MAVRVASTSQAAAELVSEVDAHAKVAHSASAQHSVGGFVPLTCVCSDSAD